VSGEVEAALARATSGQIGRRIRAPCPFCEDERGKSDTKHALSVEAATGLYYCWRCHRGGKIDAPRASPSPLLMPGEDDVLELPMDLPPGFIPLWSEPYLSSVSLADACAYLARRKVSPELACELGIGAVLDGYYAGRVIVPHVVRNRLLEPYFAGWIGRDYTGRAGRPYTYPRGMQRSLLWNHDALGEKSNTPVLVVEGVFDAIALWPHAVAVLGQPTQAHLSALRQTARPVVWCLDSDVWASAWGYAQGMRMSGHAVGALRLPPGVDPDEMPREALLAAAELSLSEPL
jgi:hypothetical protein